MDTAAMIGSGAAFGLLGREERKRAMNSHQSRVLGRRGLRVTLLGFGGAPIGELYQRIPEEQACGAVRAAYESGVRYFDTAPFYGYGLSEHRMGHVLRQYPRDSYVLSTKVGRTLLPRVSEFDPGMWAGGLRFAPRFDYTYDGFMRQFEDSLQRLGVNRVETLAIHDLDRIHHESEEVLEVYFDQLESSGVRALQELREQGAISAYGAGINQIRFCRRFVERADVDFFLIAGRYTLLDQSALEEVLPLCEQKGVSITIAGPYNSGILASGPGPEAKYDYQTASSGILEKARRLQVVCADFGVPLAAAALHFPTAHPAVSSVIPGAISAREAEQNAALMAVEIPGELWVRLKEEGLLAESVPTPE